jgi:hypothetical protein
VRRRLAAAAAVALAGCSTGDGLEALQARIDTPDRGATLGIDGCGRDDDIIVLGASSASVRVQLLLVLDDDEVDLDASGLTVTLGDRGTLGAGDAELIQAEGPAGTITSARVRGDRIDVVADAEPTTRGSDLSAGEVELAARCTAEEDLAAGQVSSSTRSAVASSIASRAARIRPLHHSMSSAARRTRSARTSTSTSTSSIWRRIDSSSVTASP